MTNSKLLVLDLDETLVHATETKLAREPDFKAFQYYVYKRPHVEDFLDYALNNFRVAVWTNSSSDYAALIVEQIFGHRRSELQFVWSYRRCTQKYFRDLGEFWSVKQLKKVWKKGFPKEHILAVDNDPEKFYSSYRNYIRVDSFEGKLEDKTLKNLAHYLETLKDVNNVRRIEKRGWWLHYSA